MKPAPIVYNKWVQIQVIIDLTANTCQEYYDGVLIASGVWDDNNHTTLEAIDLYGNGASSIYYDDLQVTAYIEPTPADGAVDVGREPQLSWKGAAAPTYNVYLGTSYDDVATATTANPPGVLVGSGLNTASFEPDRLDLGQTYYWRVDRVTADGVRKGRVWSFASEPLSYALNAAAITATASSTAAATGPSSPASRASRTATPGPRAAS